MELKKDCKNFYQHYGYDKNKKYFHAIDCGHCLKQYKIKTCKNCPYYQPRIDCEETQIFNLMHSLKYIEKLCDQFEKSLSKLT